MSEFPHKSVYDAPSTLFANKVRKIILFLARTGERVFGASNQIEKSVISASIRYSRDD